jgi:ApbE superfamily uncharacterized protein (UPF0280 family)
LLALLSSLAAAAGRCPSAADAAAALLCNENDFGVSNTIVRVTTSLDAGAAFSASVEAAKNFTKGELAEPALFDPIPNPVSAEPMTESAKDLNSSALVAASSNMASSGIFNVNN